MSSQRIAFFSLIISSILWASAGTVAKLLFPYIDPFPLGMLRLGVASTILFFLFFLKHKPTALIKALPDTFPVALGAVGNLVFFFLGVSRTTANAAAIIYTVTPLLTFFYAKKAINEHTESRKLIGIIMGLLGVLFILVLPVLRHQQTVNGDIIGNLLIVCALFSWTYYIVGARKLIAYKNYEPITVTTIAMGASFVSFILLTLFTPHRPIFSAAITGNRPFLIFYFGAVVTAMTYLMHQWAIKHSSATTAALTNYLQPVFAFTFNAIFIGERITTEFLLGSVLVLGGTMLATGSNARKIAQLLQIKRRP